MKKTAIGFTIVELLIVIVVIAILAAISVVAYTGIQSRAYNSTAASDATHFAKKMELLRAHLGRYPTSAADFSSEEFKFTKGAYLTDANNHYYYTNASGSAYAFGMRNRTQRGFLIVNGNVNDNAGTINGQIVIDALAAAGGGTYSFGMVGVAGVSGGGAGWNQAWSWTSN